MKDSLTVEKLEIIIHSLSRPNGGCGMLIHTHQEELAALLEKHVLPVLKTEELIKEVIKNGGYDA